MKAFLLALTLVLNWTAATDNVSPQAALVYQVWRSTSPNIATVADAERNGALVLDYGAARTDASVPTGPGTYYFNVIVKDEAGNKAAYTMTSVTVPVSVPDAIAPTITAQPLDVTVRTGQTATFSVTATGSPAPTYRWTRNGVTITGATAASYSLVASSRDNNVKFQVFIANSAGTATSRAATLHVRK